MYRTDIYGRLKTERRGLVLDSGMYFYQVRTTKKEEMTLVNGVKTWGWQIVNLKSIE